MAPRSRSQPRYPVLGAVRGRWRNGSIFLCRVRCSRRFDFSSRSGKNSDSRLPISTPHLKGLHISKLPTSCFFTCFTKHYGKHSRRSHCTKLAFRSDSARAFKLYQPAPREHIRSVQQRNGECLTAKYCMHTEKPVNIPVVFTTCRFNKFCSVLSSESGSRRHLSRSIAHSV